MTPTELYGAVLITSGGMTKVLKQLEADGSVERSDNPKDQRSRFVRLTAAGAERAEAVMAAVAEHDRMTLSRAMSEDQIGQLGDVLLGALRRLEGGS